MGEFVYERETNLIKSSHTTDIATKSNARILVLSDSHTNSYVVEKILLQFGASSDALIFCGDGIYDLINTIEKSASDRNIKNSLPKIIAFAKGNGDPDEVYLELDSKSKFDITVPNTQKIKIANKNILFTHGHLFNVYYGLTDLQKAVLLEKPDIVFFGHTHVPQNTKLNNTYFVNPGSCHLPRRNSLPSFLQLEINNGNLIFNFYSINISITNGVCFSHYRID